MYHEYQNLATGWAKEDLKIDLNKTELVIASRTNGVCELAVKAIPEIVLENPEYSKKFTVKNNIVKFVQDDKFVAVNNGWLSSCKVLKPTDKRNAIIDIIKQKYPVISLRRLRKLNTAFVQMQKNKVMDFEKAI